MLNFKHNFHGIIFKIISLDKKKDIIKISMKLNYTHIYFPFANNIEYLSMF